MLFGMPLDAWLLLLVAIGLGLTLEVMFFLGRRRERSSSERAGRRDTELGA
jgi:hypothetical protein